MWSWHDYPVIRWQMIGHIILLATVGGFLAVIWRLSSRGDNRDWHGFFIVLAYAVISYLIWATTINPLYYFGPTHALGGLVFLLFGTKMSGRVLSLCFMFLILLDMVTLLGIVPLKQTTGVWFEVSYPSLKGMVSLFMLIAIYLGAGDVRIDRPYYLYSSDPDGTRSDLSGTQEMDEKATHEG